MYFNWNKGTTKDNDELRCDKLYVSGGLSEICENYHYLLAATL